MGRETLIMKCNFEIDYLRKNIEIERKAKIIDTDYFRPTRDIARIFVQVAIERKIRRISIDREKFRVIRFNIPVPFNWVNVQNDWLPIEGEYFLN